MIFETQGRGGALLRDAVLPGDVLDELLNVLGLKVFTVNPAVSISLQARRERSKLSSEPGVSISLQARSERSKLSSLL